MNSKYTRYEISRILLIFWCLFIGIGAVFGGVSMLIAPDGSILHMQNMLPYFKVLPFSDILFQDYFFSGIALLIVNGLTNFIAGTFLFLRKKIGIILGTIFGITLILWICIQFYMFPLNFLDNAYFTFGLLQVICGFICLVSYNQKEFIEKESLKNYDDLVSPQHTTTQNSKTLIVFFSRMGYTKKYAYSLKEKLNADIYEVKTTERIEGTLGFWWCGRFGMHRWQMPIQKLTLDFTKYERLIICTPIWVFNICAPIRTFCSQVASQISGKNKSVEYVIVHFQTGKYKNAAKTLDELLNVKREKVTSISVHQGKEIKRFEY